MVVEGRACLHPNRRANPTRTGTLPQTIAPRSRSEIKPRSTEKSPWVHFLHGHRPPRGRCLKSSQALPHRVGRGTVLAIRSHGPISDLGEALGIDRATA